MGAEAGGILEIGCGFQLELRLDRELVSRAFELNSRALELRAREAMRCSLAFRDALVSWANLGVGLRNLEVDGDIDG